MKTTNKIKKIVHLEKLFSRNLYNGCGKSNYVIESGTIPIMISAPHSVNHFRDGEVKCCDMFTGGIARYLHGLTGCHVIYSSKFSKTDPNNDPVGNNEYQEDLQQYVNANNIKLLIDLHGSSKSRPYAVELGTITDDDKSLHGMKFIGEFITEVFDFYFKSLNIEIKEIWKNKIFSAGSRNTVTNYISTNTKTATIQLEINGHYRDPGDVQSMESLINGLEYIINSLSRINWNSNSIQSFKLWQAKNHKPINKIELYGDINQSFKYGDAINIYANGSVKIGGRASPISKSPFDDESRGQKLALLTNRFIEQLFGQEWSADKIGNIPILISHSDFKSFEFGIPKADFIDKVTLSTALYDEMLDYSKDNYIILYNRYTDSHLILDMDNADYKDNGRVKSKDGTGKKVMMPRYFKILMGYMDFPINVIRAEEYEKMMARFNLSQRYLFDKCYEHVVGDSYYKIRKNLYDEDLLKKVTAIQNEIGLYDSVEIIMRSKSKGFDTKMKAKECDNLRNKIAKLFVGESEHLMTTTWGNEIDDQNGIVRMNKTAMGMLGVLENDMVLITYGKRQSLLKVLEWDELNDYQISIPAPCRKELGMNNINGVIRVKRYALHIFRRKSTAQTIAILGALFGALRIPIDIRYSILLCIPIAPIILFFMMRDERIKVK